MLFSKFDRILIIFIIVVFGTIFTFSFNIDQTQPFHDARQMAIGTESIMSDYNTLLAKYGGTGLTYCSNGTVLKWMGNSTTGHWYCGADDTGIYGSGVANYLTKWASSIYVGASRIYDNGSFIGIGTTNPRSTFQVNTGTNSNLAIGSAILVPSATTLSAYNDAASANIPLEIRALQTIFNVGTVGIAGSIPLELGWGITGKATSAGEFIYSTNVLDIFGAGAKGAERVVKIWDKLVVQNDVCIERGNCLSSSGGAYTYWTSEAATSDNCFARCGRQDKCVLAIRSDRSEVLPCSWANAGLRSVCVCLR